MTSAFRRAAYAAVEEAQLAGMGQDDLVVVHAPPGDWQFPLRDLKAELRRDQMRLKRARQQNT